MTWSGLKPFGRFKQNHSHINKDAQVVSHSKEEKLSTQQYKLDTN